MSHNLTDRELNDLIAAAVAVTERMSPEERAAMMEAQRQSWARGEAGLRETSASPPRVPGASAQCTRAGVESGPGQPMTDICERLDADADILGSLSDPWGMSSAALEREAAAEIRRLRARCTQQGSIIARQQREAVEAAGKRSEHVAYAHRAGIETAAHRIETFTFSPGLHAYTVSAVKNVLSQVVRALAYAPKSDPLPANEWPTHVEMERE